MFDQLLLILIGVNQRKELVFDRCHYTKIHKLCRRLSVSAVLFIENCIFFLYFSRAPLVLPSAVLRAAAHDCDEMRESGENMIFS